MKLGYNLFYVDNVPTTMNFYKAAFGLKTGFLHESNQYGEMETGDTKIGFVNHETAGSHGFGYEKMNLKNKCAAFEIGFISDNVEKDFAKAVKAGAVAVCQPVKKPWGQVVSYVRDCNGFLIEICSAM